eukprot:6212559-Pleurochrysis_carterae.AAC.2
MRACVSEYEKKGPRAAMRWMLGGEERIASSYALDVWGEERTASSYALDVWGRRKDREQLCAGCLERRMDREQLCAGCLGRGRNGDDCDNEGATEMC